MVFKFPPFSVVVVVAGAGAALFKILLPQIFPLIWPEGWVETFLYSKLYERGGEITNENTTLFQQFKSKKKESQKIWKVSLNFSAAASSSTAVIANTKLDRDRNCLLED